MFGKSGDGSTIALQKMTCLLFVSIIFPGIFLAFCPS